MTSSPQTFAMSSMDFSWCFSAVALVTTMASLSSALEASSTARPCGSLVGRAFAMSSAETSVASLFTYSSRLPL